MNKIASALFEIAMWLISIIAVGGMVSAMWVMM